MRERQKQREEETERETEEERDIDRQRDRVTERDRDRERDRGRDRERTLVPAAAKCYILHTSPQAYDKLYSPMYMCSDLQGDIELFNACIYARVKAFLRS